MNKITFIGLMLILAGCATSHTKSSIAGRVFIDSTSHEDNPPEWVKNSKMGWEDGNYVFVKSSHTINGSERINGCFDLAKLNTKEAVITEIASDIKGRIDNAQTSISENSETILGKVRTEEYQGRVVGLAFKEQYFERYSTADVERQDCHVLAAIKKSDYDRLKRAIVDKIVEVDPEIKKAIQSKQIDFFSSRNPAQQ